MRCGEGMCVCLCVCVCVCVFRTAPAGPASQAPVAISCTGNAAHAPAKPTHQHHLKSAMCVERLSLPLSLSLCVCGGRYTEILVRVIFLLILVMPTPTLPTTAPHTRSSGCCSSRC